ncbi:hypothetical protein PR048_015432 [Dryococelus australis]|uniref:Uncharacterized protein n=1 Tax=Dryococelus australis TaxID=614101 RepID=A0ABQ9HGY5_9NEOP|nr:hypothetical protein PR048_015432 [Dryococelus australis]
MTTWSALCTIFSVDCSSTVKIGFPEGSSPSHVAAGTVDRLKPPPSSVGVEQKKIKLSGSSSGSESKRLEMVYLSHTNGDCLDQVIIKEKVTVQPTSSSEQVEAPRKIKLKRSHSNTSAVISSCQVSVSVELLPKCNLHLLC